jgi:C-terminal processing protease CtpA/Prc
MKKYIITGVISILLLSFSCSKDTDDVNNAFEVSTEDEINAFIWKGLNPYYLWQEEVPILADTRFNNEEEIYTFFKSASSPEATFRSLLYRPGTIDRFSWIVADYIALENSFQGINLSTGMEFGLRRYVNSNVAVFGYVRYVVPNSSAANANIARGMYFNMVNGIQLTDTNYRNLLFGEDANLFLGLATYNAGNPISNNISVSLLKTAIQENPIAIAKVIKAETKKIGYLMYNQFSSSFDQDLNNVFNSFKAAAIDDLIIDLRYNGGGSTSTAGYLGSMITGQFEGEVFSKEVWNSKVTNAVPANSFINNFPTRIAKTNNGVFVDETIHSLGLQTVYFIVSESSASASELVINALNAHIDVKVVGTTTVGKQVGSITLYDSENYRRNGLNLNPKHTYAMQPLVLEIKNKDDQNFPQGIIPELNITGIALPENIGDLGVLGERSDPLLDRTLTYITTSAKTRYKKENFIRTEEIFNSKLATPASNNMYSELK